MFVDERTFPLIFFDKELLEYAAPYEQRRETWRVRAGYGAQTIPEIVSANTRPQLALMIVLALIMGGGVFFVAGAAAREVRVAELKSNFVASVSHDLKTPLALIQLFAETLELGPRTERRARAGVLPDHQSARRASSRASSRTFSISRAWKRACAPTAPRRPTSAR